MKILYHINKIFILITSLLALYAYTTFFGFLGFGDAELEKFLIIPFFVIPLLIVGFLINLFIKFKLNLSYKEIFIPLIGCLIFFLPLLINDTLSYFFKIDLINQFMVLGTILSLAFIIWSVLVYFIHNSQKSLKQTSKTIL